MEEISNLEVQSNTLSKKDAKVFGGVLGERVTAMTDDEIKKGFITMIDTHVTDEDLVVRLKQGLFEATYEGPKGTILTDWKTITQIAKLLFQLKGKLKDNSQINIVNAFGNTGIVL